MPRISQITDIDFDGVNHPYVPPAVLRISPKLKLHREWDESQCAGASADGSTQRHTHGARREVAHHLVVA